MSDNDMTKRPTRRKFFGWTGIGAVLLGVSARRTTAEAAEAAEAAVSKSSVQYQDVPGASGQVCVQCVYYIPLAPGASLGSCKLVTGGIAPGGWCIAWAPKA